jgi:putative transposase
VEVCRRHGVSEATFYKWKAKYGGLEVSDARRLNGREEGAEQSGGAIARLCRGNALAGGAADDLVEDRERPSRIAVAASAVREPGFGQALSRILRPMPETISG